MLEIESVNRFPCSACSSCCVFGGGSAERSKRMLVWEISICYTHESLWSISLTAKYAICTDWVLYIIWAVVASRFLRKPITGPVLSVKVLSRTGVPPLCISMERELPVVTRVTSLWVLVDLLKLRHASWPVLFGVGIGMEAKLEGFAYRWKYREGQGELIGWGKQEPQSKLNWIRRLEIGYSILVCCFAVRNCAWSTCCL